MGTMNVVFIAFPWIIDICFISSNIKNIIGGYSGAFGYGKCLLLYYHAELGRGIAKTMRGKVGINLTTPALPHLDCHVNPHKLRRLLRIGHGMRWDVANVGIEMFPGCQGLHSTLLPPDRRNVAVDRRAGVY
jgi:hypothetical protein